MSNSFQYSVLKYRPSYLLDERVNIGLLFYFAGSEKFVFRYPSHLGRISKAFPKSLHLTDIRQYLRFFKSKATILTKEGLNLKDKELKDVIHHEFLVKDANSLFFSEVKVGFYETETSILDFYEDQYFKFYNPRNERKKHNDAYVKHHFEEVLKDLAGPHDLRVHYFKKDVEIKNKINTTEFDFGWQNGTSNLVKTLGFDLVNKENIQTKAFKWFGEITHLDQFAKNYNVRFDFVVAPPQKKSLFEAYNKALEVLNNIETNKLIIEENSIEEYIGEALHTVKPSSFESLTKLD